MNRKKRSSSNFVRTALAVEKVRKAFQNDPQMSLRRLEAQDGMPSASTIHRILKEANFHPYKIQLIHQLKPQDCVKRVKHAQDQLVLIENHPNFLNSLVFSDKAHFHIQGMVNKQDFRYWSQTNPQWSQELPLHSPRITVWAAIGCHGVVGPFFFQENVNGANYLDMLQQQFLPQVQNSPNFSNMIFMQDGAPPHWSAVVRNFLNETFPNRWMGRGSPNLPWPPYSPDLTPMDFFLWGFLKSRVYGTPIADITELRFRIVQAFENIPLEFVKRAMGAYKHRLHLCIERNGESVEKKWHAVVDE